MVKNWRAIVMTVALLAPVMAPVMAPAGSRVATITPDQLDQLRGQGVMVIDVRRADEWRSTGVIPGSGMITAFDASGRLRPEFLSEVEKVADHNRPLALICRSGNRSGKASEMLTGQAGYTHVYNVDGGINEWIDQGKAITPCPSC